ncbi:tyrosine-protein phosphatase [Sphingobium bisphenolivorans]|uniref:tyrosine-protein phosphatase n=1 Tax=Sphingobium bisphenolivorans TaxID=1335760 RepID=UPI00039FAF3F|nr:tyrosine-protein phosphatase [Sphingobium bisphenolivorans]
MIRTFILPLLTGLFASTAMAGTIDSPVVTRSAPTELTVTWSDGDPVDIFLSHNPAARPEEAKLMSKGDRDGRESFAVGEGERAYILLRDTKTGRTRRVAERLLPLQQASNFRDIGGYPAAGGKHVRWGLIYRSGGQPMLTDTDLSQIGALKLSHLVDLRSSEERMLAPSRIEGVPYQAVGYSMKALLKGPMPGNGEGVYRTMPLTLAPLLRLVFQDLLAKDGAVAYNCSAGQDRTGFVTAMILSALGVPRDVILSDYHLSTAYRRPEWELPKIDPAAHGNDPVALMFADFQRSPTASKPQPLKTADGTAFLSFAFDEIEKKWGSVDTYLAQQAGVSKIDLAALRTHYLE